MIEEMTAPKRKPDWLKIKLPSGRAAGEMRKGLRAKQLYTVCEEASCPNQGECWDAGTATVMLMGDTCTRACRFCGVKTGNPRGWLDREEPLKVAQMADVPGLRYIVLTSVDRDDLSDFGAAHYAETVAALKAQRPDLLVEALVPDFQGRFDCVHTLCDSGVDVFGHNLETVESLHPKVRDKRATYAQSLAILAEAKRYLPTIMVKSSLMLGLGEERGEVLQAFHDMRTAGVEILTLGQYLAPSSRHLPVERYLEPQEFEQLRTIAESEFGFAYCASGPLVRSSYRAAEAYVASQLSV